MSPDHARHLTFVTDVVSAGTALGAILGFFPPIAALAACMWYSIQVWESHTVQKWYRLKFRMRRTVPRHRRRRKLERRIGGPLYSALEHVSERVTLD